MPDLASLRTQVDVWAVGVMLYQMLYGRRPFGEGLSQEEIMREQVMLKARRVAFPAKPAVSAECKDFITRCAAAPHPRRGVPLIVCRIRWWVT